MTALHDSDFGKRLCEILHLDPKKTVDITIVNKINDIVKVEVVQYLQDEEAKELIKELQLYELHLIGKKKISV